MNPLIELIKNDELLLEDVCELLNLDHIKLPQSVIDHDQLEKECLIWAMKKEWSLKEYDSLALDKKIPKKLLSTLIDNSPIFISEDKRKLIKIGIKNPSELVLSSIRNKIIKDPSILRN